MSSQCHLIINIMRKSNQGHLVKEFQSQKFFSQDLPDFSFQEAIKAFCDFKSDQSQNSQLLFQNTTEKAKDIQGETSLPIEDHITFIYGNGKMHSQIIPGQKHSQSSQNVALEQIRVINTQIFDHTEFQEPELPFCTSVFQKISLRKATVKNTNIPKFLVKTFRDIMKEDLKYQKDIVKQHFNDESSLKSFKNLLSSISGVGKNQFNIQDLIKIFAKGSSLNPQFRKTNRIAFRKILRTRLRSEIIQRSNIRARNKLTYLITSKVYALRCMRASLTSRVQSR